MSLDTSIGLQSLLSSEHLQRIESINNREKTNCVIASPFLISNRQHAALIGWMNQKEEAGKIFIPERCLIPVEWRKKD